jgi:hypothetical protein
MPDEPKERRDALKIMGSIGATCLFPFQADELYGQHEHPEGSMNAATYQRQFFDEKEFEVLSALVDEILPATDTPSASAAGVPAYIDYVMTKNHKLAEICRKGIQDLRRKKFLWMEPAERQRLLQGWCDSAEKAAPAKKLGKNERFWMAIKNLTADGYYTSKVGMREELGYKGNAPMAAYPSCEVVPEH